MNNKECAILILISMVMVSMIVSIFMTGVGLIMLIWCFIFIVIIENNEWFIYKRMGKQKWIKNN